MNIYISGIEQECGKTVISAGIAAVMQSLGYKTGVYKPIQTNAINKEEYLLSPDLSFVKMLDPYITTHSTYMFTSKAVPEVCAQIEYTDIKLDDIIDDYKILDKKTDTLIVEGNNGLMTPLKDKVFSYRIPQILKIPVLFIITPSSCSIGQYINEINNAKNIGLDIAGVIINKYSHNSDSPEVKSFPEIITKYTDTKILGIIRKFKGRSVKSNTLFNEILNGINFEEVFRIKIPKLSNN